MESTSRSQRKCYGSSHCVPSSFSDHSSEPDCLPATEAVSDMLADFMEAVRPFHRAVYLVALACTNDATRAELVAVRAMAAAFRTWRRKQIGNELNMFLIGITLSEAQPYLHRAADIEDWKEDIGDALVFQRATEWLPIPLHTVHDRSVYDALIGAMQELSANTRLTLIMRDALNLTTVQIAGLLGESLQRIQTRLGYGRIMLCMKLSMPGSDLDLSGQARVSTVC